MEENHEKLSGYKTAPVQANLPEVYSLWKASREATILDVTATAGEIQYIDISLTVGRINQVKLLTEANPKHLAVNLEK